MGKPRLCVKAKVYNLGLSIVAATAAASSNCEPAATTKVPTQATSADSTPASTTCTSDAELFVHKQKSDAPLPSIEEKLGVLNSALEALEKPGLSRSEVNRLNKIIQGIKVYQELLASYMNYRAIELDLLKMKQQYAPKNNRPTLKRIEPSTLENPKPSSKD